MTSRSLTILEFLSLLDEGVNYSHLTCLNALQRKYSFTRQTAISYIEDMKGMGLLKRQGPELLVRDEDTFTMWKERSQSPLPKS